ncbi:MAG TPA: radical SAM protein [Puia sp.]|jgi:MoaA/NifB/PqqE/SkfB family radical SAM enzyme
MKALLIPPALIPGSIIEDGYLETISIQERLSSLKKNLVWLAIRTRILLDTLISLKSVSKSIKAFRSLNKLRKETWGGNMKKIYKVDGKYYFNLYTPGWPSDAYDQLVRNEIRRLSSPVSELERARFIFLAVTTKCPLRCEHCFEWDNLNQKETFSREELIQIVDIFQKEGVNQIHFSGGEPMVRFRDLLEVLRFAALKSECYIVTSGFNLTLENACLLKIAGCKGIIVSIDHYIPEMHNRFRQHPEIFYKAVAGVNASIRSGMVTAISICATKEFLDGGHLHPYMQFARSLGVHFVQVLEPKAVGHYAGKTVMLEERHLTILEEYFKKANHDPEYADYPTLMYHGYHQRRIGCYSGSRSVYVDSAGNVHACPFCHTHSYNMKDILNATDKSIPVKENICPRYGRVV